MNLVEFLEQVDQTANDLDNNALKHFVHEYARSLADSERQSFLQLLRKHLEEEIPSDQSSLSEEDKQLFLAQKNEVIEKLSKIDNEEYYISEEYEYHESYDDYWYDDEPEFFYESDEFIPNTVNAATELILNLIDSGLYKDGLDLFNTLLDTGFYISSDWDPKLISFYNLKKYIPINNCEVIFIPVLYALYKSTPVEKRMEEILNIVGLLNFNQFRIEALLQYGEEFDDTREFLDTSIEYLGSEIGNLERKLLFEALFLRNDQEIIIEKAKQFSDTHPGLYFDILENNKFLSDSERIEFGLEGLKNIDFDLEIRHDIALKVLELALKNKRDDIIDQILLETFKAKPTPKEYLRALYFSRDVETIKNSLSKIIRELSSKPKKEDVYHWGVVAELSEFSPNDEQVLALEFFNGDFKKVFDRKLSGDKAIGWTHSFIKEALALTLMLLDREDQVFNNRKYVKEFARKGLKGSYTIYDYDNSDEEFDLFQAFMKWKETLPEIDENTAQNYLNTLENLMQKRVEAIMDNNRRNYYSECADFIAALGEVEESRGMRGAKERLINYYHSQYPRRRNFVADLRAVSD